MTVHSDSQLGFWKQLTNKFRQRAGMKRHAGRRRALQMELLESRRNFAAGPLVQVDPPISVAPRVLRPLAAESAMLIPTGETPVHFYLDARQSSTADELGYFFVDGPDGRITRRIDNDPLGDPLLDGNGQPQYVFPGDPDYAELALTDENAETVFSSVDGVGEPADVILDVLGDKYIAFYVMPDSSLDEWNLADPDARPTVWFSLRGANGDGYDHFQRTSRMDSAFRQNVRQYKVETSTLIASNQAGTRADFNDLTFSVNVVPFATYDDYTVFNAGANFTGAPVGFKADTPDDGVNRGLGLLWNDKSFRGLPLSVTAIRIDEDSDWVPLNVKSAGRTMATLSDDSLHGTVTVYSNGGIRYVPDVNDPYWYPSADDPEPESIYFEYQISDGLDVTEQYVGISHGFYQRGGSVDNRHSGQKTYLLGGGGDTTEFSGAARKFFGEGSNFQDVVLIAQGGESKDWVDTVYTDFTDSSARSVTSLSITTREQANDPRIVQLVRGADALWFGGGAQSFYQKVWRGTRLFSEFVVAASSSVAIGGTSAGMAILGELSYIDLPWDSVKSRFATSEPRDPRVNVVSQGGDRLPFSGLSNTVNAPLRGIVTDTHFSGRNRLGRLATFMTKAAWRPMMGVGVDEDTGLLIEKAAGGDWLWSVYGLGNVYVVTPSSSSVMPSYQNQGRLTYGPLNVLRLDPAGADGAQLLSSIKTQSPSYRVNVSAGSVYTTENGGSLY